MAVSTAVPSELEVATTLSDDEGCRRSATLRNGEKLARYVVLERIGAGATGVVYSAHDPELDRRVAVKLLQRVTPGDRKNSQRRLLREARALAQLSHPNVVTIHDVGTFEGRVFIAMEYVEGETLSAWLQSPRSWSEVLAVFRAAGEGLAAAHEVGMVHRDFKPDNVMVDESRVRVMDFGLARAATDSEDDSLTTTLEISRLQDISSVVTDRLTRTGAVMGTPAYMAPELFYGRPAGPLSDQFSFAVALHEALFSERPFEGDAPVELALSVTSGRRRATSRRQVPLWLCDALSRALEVDPHDRYPNMRSMLAALREPIRSRRWARAASGVAVAAVAGIAWSSNEAEPCPAPDARIAEVWNTARATEIETAFGATGLPFAERSATTVRGHLDEYARRWTAAHVEACRATRISGVQPEEMFDRRMACLDRRLELMAGLVDEFAAAHADTVTTANATASSLAFVSMCAEVADLDDRVAPPASREDQREADRITAEAVQAEVLGHGSNAKHALATLDALLIAAQALDYPPVVGRIQAKRAFFLDVVGREEEGIEAAEEAVWIARAAGDAPLEARAAVTLVDQLARSYRLQEAERWVRHAETVTRQMPPESEVHWHLDLGRGLVALNRERFEDARAHIQRGVDRCLEIEGPMGCTSAQGWLADAELAAGHIDLAVQHHQEIVDLELAELGADHPDVANARANLAQALRQQGRLDEALAHLDAAEKTLMETFPDHPNLPGLWSTQAIVYLYQDRYPESERAFRRALDALLPRVGPRHPNVLGLRGNIAMTLYAQGKYEEALEKHYEALAASSAVFGDESLEAANIRGNIGDVLAALGRPREAEEQYAQTFAVRAALAGPEHPDTARASCNLGDVTLAQGRLSDARARIDRCIGTYVAVFGPDHPLLAGPTASLARIAMEEKRVDDGIGLFERALALAERKDGAGTEVERIRGKLAQARWDAGRDRAQAWQDVKQARDALAEVGGLWQENADELTTWLESHRP